MKGRKKSVAQSIHEIDFQKLTKTASHPRERMRYLALPTCVIKKVIQR